MWPKFYLRLTAYWAGTLVCGGCKTDGRIHVDIWREDIFV